MSRFSRRQILCLAGFGPVTPAMAQLIGKGSGGWSIRGTEPIEVFHGDRRVTSYRTGYESIVPRFEPVVGPTGKACISVGQPKEVTSKHWPGGLGFALENVNGYRFLPGVSEGQEENPLLKRGLILHRGMNGVLIKDSAVVMRVKSEWVDAEDPVRRIASDRREITLFHREDGSLALSLSLELMADAGDLELGVDETGGWMVGLVPGMAWKKEEREEPVFRNREGLRNSEAQKAGSNWVVCQGLDAGGTAAGVAVLDHPGNPGSPARWTLDGEGVLSAHPFSSEGAAKTMPVLVPNGESVFFRYRTIFFGGEVPDEEVVKAYEAFAQR